MPERKTSLKKISETRKLVKWGSSKTLIMSLPRSWTKKLELTEKDEVHVFENPDGSLLIMPLKQDDTENNVISADVDVEKYDDWETFSYVIKTKVLDGNDVINIISKNPISQDLNNHITSLVGDLLGFEIISRNPQSIKIKDIMALKEASLNELIRMVSSNVLDLINNFHQAIVNKADEAHFQAILSSRESIQRYYIRVHRQLRKGLMQPSILMRMEISNQEAVDFAFYIVIINDIAEYLASMSKALLKTNLNDFKILHKALPILTLTQEILTDAISAFLFRETKKAFEVLKSVETAKTKKRKVENKIDKEINDEDSLVASLGTQIILDNCEKIIEGARSIALAALRRAL
ncbi:MAG: AbrB/MazE/SpoVT family DNA-binding domain-containing protein [Candidatus Helarchaeota archaeon]